MFLCASSITQNAIPVGFLDVLKRKIRPFWTLIYIHRTYNRFYSKNGVAAYDRSYCTLGWPHMTGFTVQWGGRLWQVLLYREMAMTRFTVQQGDHDRGVTMYDRFYCTVGWPCMTGFTVQRGDHVWQVLLYSRVSVYDTVHCTAGWPHIDKVYCTVERSQIDRFTVLLTSG